MDNRSRYRVVEPQPVKPAPKPVILGGVKVRAMPKTAAAKNKRSFRWPKQLVLPKLTIPKVSFNKIPNFGKPINHAALSVKSLYKKSTGSFASNRKLQIGSAVAVVCIVTAVVLAVSLGGGSDKTVNNPSTAVLGTNSNGQSTGQVQSQNSCPGGDEQPDFDLLFPKGKTAQDLGGICRTSPQTSSAVFTYVDTVGVNNIVKVNQQQIPEQLSTTEKLSAFAAENYYKNIINANGITIYYGSDIKGSQFLVFTEKNLLVFIRSDSKLEDIVWSSYIASLE